MKEKRVIGSLEERVEKKEFRVKEMKLAIIVDTRYVS